MLSRKLSHPWETIEFSTMFHRMIFLATLVLVTASGVYAQAETVVVRPVESEELLVNPGMGITTFQRFNGQELNAGLSWSEANPIFQGARLLTVAGSGPVLSQNRKKFAGRSLTGRCSRPTTIIKPSPSA